MRNMFQQEVNKYKLSQTMVKLTEDASKPIGSLPLFISFSNSQSCLETNTNRRLFSDSPSDDQAIPPLLKPCLKEIWRTLNRKYLSLKAYRILNKSLETSSEFITAQLILHKACRYMDEKCAVAAENQPLDLKNITVIKNNLIQYIFDRMIKKETSQAGEKEFFLAKSIGTPKPLKINWSTGATSMFFSFLRNDNDSTLPSEVASLSLDTEETESLLKTYLSEINKMNSDIVHSFITEHQKALPENLLFLLKDDFNALYQKIDLEFAQLPIVNTEECYTQL